jgi:hypothetical protein
VASVKIEGHFCIAARVWKNRFSHTGLFKTAHAAHLSARIEKSIFPYGPLKEPYAKIKFEKFETSVSHSYELQIR